MAERERITLLGIREALDYFDRLEHGAAALGRARVLVGSNVFYARVVEFGEDRARKLHRKKGGAFYLRGGLESVKARIKPAILEAIPRGEGAVLRAMLRLGYQVEAKARQIVPVRTGNLRRSIHTVAGRRD